MKNQKCISVKVADIVFSMSSCLPVELIDLDQAYYSFLCTEKPDVTIQVSYDGIPQLPLQAEDKVFDSEMLWSLYRNDGRNIVALNSPTVGLYRIAVFEADFRQGEVYNREEIPAGLLPNPLEYPLAEILMVSLLAQGRGLMVHACGIDDGGRGYLFAGNSTNGKSTMARLWQDKARILNDDRIVLRQRGGRLWMYGTPWHGDYTGVSPQGVPLEKIFFIRHASANTFSRKEGVVASSMLLTRCFPPLWDKDGMNFTLGFCDQIISRVPCYELGFLPDEKVVDFVRCVA